MVKFQSEIKELVAKYSHAPFNDIVRVLVRKLFPYDNIQVQVALVILGLSIRCFDYSRIRKVRIARESFTCITDEIVVV